MNVIAGLFLTIVSIAMAKATGQVALAASGIEAMMFWLFAALFAACAATPFVAAVVEVYDTYH